MTLEDNTFCGFVVSVMLWLSNEKELATIKVIILLFIIIKTVKTTPCEIKPFKTGLVCVCNSTFCDTLELELPEKDGQVLIVSTSKNGLRYQQAKSRFGTERLMIANGPYHYGGTNQRSSNYNKIRNIFQIPSRLREPVDMIINVEVNRSMRYQKIIGFGGAFTGAVSYNLKKLNSELRKQIYQSYYSKKIGNGYNMMRIPIGGSDFDTQPWAYNELPTHDEKLSNFTKLDGRDLERIEQIDELKKVTDNNDIKIFGSAWSPPPWMKTNNDWTGFGKLRDEYYQSWADYHVKYLELMNKQNVTYWAITTGNEPLNGVIGFLFVRFMSLGWTPKNQGQWVGDNLGPSMKKSKIARTVKILAGDDQRYTFPWWFERMYDGSPDVVNYIDGFAVHWYWDKFGPATPLDKAVEKFPGKFIIASEACSGDKPWDAHKPILGSWYRCEDYITDIIDDLNHYVSAWVDWNLMLDENGGPNYARNYVDAAIIVNGTEIYKQPIFYAMGHFSRFIIAGSVRISSKSTSKFIKSTAFLRPDEFTAVVLYNLAEHALDVNLNDKSRGVFKLSLPAKSIHTILYK